MPQKLHSSCREHQHAKKNQSVPPTLYVGCSVCSLPIVNRNFNDLETQTSCAKQKIKISKGIKISKEFPRSSNALIMCTRKDFSAA